MFFRSALALLLCLAQGSYVHSVAYVVDITAFGAKCDGSTDDTPSFTSALTVVQNAVMGGSRIIRFPNGGKCKFTTPLTILTRGVIFQGTLGERPEESSGSSLEYSPSGANTTMISLGLPKITNITGISRAGGVVTLVYTPLPPGAGTFTVGSTFLVIVAGENNDPSFNGTFAVTSNSVGTSTLTYNQAGPDAAPVAAGTVAGAPGNADFDGVQGFTMEHMEVRCDGHATKQLDNGVDTYCDGTIAIQDNRGGDVKLDDINFEHWQYGFYGIQSDIDKFTNVNGGTNHVMIYVGPRSDQMDYNHMYAGRNDVDIWIEGARGGDYNRMISVNSGSPISAPIRCESTNGTCAFNVFRHPWLEHSGAFADQLAFFELGGIQQIDSGAVANNLFIDTPEVHVNSACCTGTFTHSLAVVNNADWIQINNPTGNVNNFTQLILFKGATSPAHVLVNKFSNLSFTTSANGGNGTPAAVVVKDPFQ